MQNKTTDLFKNITSDEMLALEKLNQILTELEKQIVEEAKKYIPSLQTRLQDPKDWLMDFEIECDFSFLLKEQDPEYNQNDDNILITINESLKHPDLHFLADNEIHNKYQFDDHPMKDQFHCWLYQRIYYYSDLPLQDLLRIGSVWTDLKVIYQYNSKI